jgi:hypothetical protein
MLTILFQNNNKTHNVSIKYDTLYVEAGIYPLDTLNAGTEQSQRKSTRTL